VKLLSRQVLANAFESKAKEARRASHTKGMNQEEGRNFPGVFYTSSLSILGLQGDSALGALRGFAGLHTREGMLEITFRADKNIDL
jgi:hypothetical protein